MQVSHETWDDVPARVSSSAALYLESSEHLPIPEFDKPLPTFPSLVDTPVPVSPIVLVGDTSSLNPAIRLFSDKSGGV